LCHPLVLSSPTLMMHGHMNLKLFCMFSFSTHVSQAYVTTGLTNVWYIRSLDLSKTLYNRTRTRFSFAANAVCAYSKGHTDI